MIDVLPYFVGAAVAGFTTILVAFAVKVVSIPRRVARHDGALVTLMQVQQYQNQALLASLEVQRDGRANGNVTAAIDIMHKAQEITTKFLSESLKEVPA